MMESNTDKLRDREGGGAGQEKGQGKGIGRGDTCVGEME